MSVPSSFVLVNLDPVNCPNGRQISSLAGIQVSDEGPGGYLIVSPSDFLESLQNLSLNGFVVKNGTNSAVSRTLTSNGTIQIANPDGVAGNPSLTILNNTSTQNVVLASNGTTHSTRGRLNFIGAGGVGVSVADNGGTSSADITITGSGGAPAAAQYLLSVPYSGLSSAFSLSTLATGILKNTTTTGVPTIAVAGTDYQAPNALLTAIAGLTPSLGSMIVGTGTTFTSRTIGASGTVPVSNGTDWAWSAASLTNPMTAVGDMIIGGTAGAPTRLAIGTTGQVLSVSSGGAPHWSAPGSGPSASATYIVQTPDASITNAQALSVLTTGLLKSTTTTGVLSTAVAGTDYVAPNANLTALSGLAVTKGGVVVANGTALTEIAVGTDGQVLTAASSQATGLNWTTPLTNPMTTQGDIIVGGTSGLPQRLAKGGANQVLAMDGTGTNEVWTTASTLTGTPNVNINIGSGGSFLVNNCVAAGVSGSISGSSAFFNCGNTSNTANSDFYLEVYSSHPSASAYINYSQLGTQTWQGGIYSGDGLFHIASGYFTSSDPLILSSSLATFNTSMKVTGDISGHTLSLPDITPPAAPSAGATLFYKSGTLNYINSSSAIGQVMPNPMTTVGDIVYNNSSGVPARLGIGTANQVLTVNSGATGVVWANRGVISGRSTLDSSGLSTVSLTGATSFSIIVVTYYLPTATLSAPAVTYAGADSFQVAGTALQQFNWMAIV